MASNLASGINDDDTLLDIWKLPRFDPSLQRRQGPNSSTPLANRLAPLTSLPAMPSPVPERDLMRSRRGRKSLAAQAMPSSPFPDTFTPISSRASLGPNPSRSASRRPIFNAESSSNGGFDASPARGARGNDSMAVSVYKSRTSTLPEPDLDVLAILELGDEANLFKERVFELSSEPLSLLQKYANICFDKYKATLDAETAKDHLPIYIRQSRVLSQRWLLERNTWILLQMLSERRLVSDQPNEQLSPVSGSDNFLVQQYIAQSPMLQEHLIIKQWLEQTAPEQHIIPPHKQLWDATKNAIGRGSKVNSLDPDGPLRQGKLEQDDEEDEHILLRYIFGYIRRGQKDEAEQLCRDVSVHWRAASLRGGVYYSNHYLDDQSTQEEYIPLGNVNRKLWKTMCLHIARQQTLHEYERAVYGALAGDIPSVAAVCLTWEDHLWARYNALIESRVEQVLQQRRSVVEEEEAEWEGAAEPPAVPESEASIFEELRNNDKSDLSQAACHPYRIVQSLLILGQLDELLAYAYGYVIDADPYDSQQLIRFFAHLVLFLRTSDEKTKVLLNENAESSRFANALVEFYVDRLIALDKLDLVAAYCLALPEDTRVVKYAQLLQTVQENRHGKQQYFVCALKYGLDWASIARTTVDNVLGSLPIDDALKDLDPLVPLVEDVSDEDRKLTHVLEWLSFQPVENQLENYASKLVRWFLAKGRVQAAAGVLQLFPRSQLDKWQNNPDDLVNELSNYMLLIHTFTLFGDWDKHRRAPPKPQARSSSTRASAIEGLETNEYQDRLRKWERQSEILTRKVEEGLQQLLQTDWLLSAHRESNAQHLRRIYIPWAAFRLHEILFSTRDYIQGNLLGSLQVGDIVADSTWQLYQEFEPSTQLPRLLLLLRESSLHLLVSTQNTFGVN